MIRLRDAVRDDLRAINDIYNYYVTRSTCTYQTEDETPDARAAWFERHGPKHPVIVALTDGQTIGWASLSPLHGRAAYRYTVETSIYIDPAYHRRGIGTLLLRELIDRADLISDENGTIDTAAVLKALSSN